MLLVELLACKLAAPQHQLIQQVVQSIVAEFKRSYLLKADDMRDEWPLDFQIAKVNVKFALSVGNQMHKWNPIIVCCHFGHQV